MAESPRLTPREAHSPVSKGDASNIHLSEHATPIKIPGTPAAVEASSHATEEEDAIQVCIRIRPFLRGETDEVSAWAWENSTITQASQEHHGNIAQRTVYEHPRDIYTFDNLFSPLHTNAEVYTKSVKPIVEQVMQGFHGSVFTYGQTSSGKTFTMNGNAKQPGVIPQTIYECFDLIKRMPEREFMFRVSYLEIYNEIVYDLLNPIPSPIKIMHNNKMGTILVGVKEQVVSSPEQVITLLQTGEAHRHTGATGMNDKSSRAHTLFKLVVESKEINSDTKSAGVRVSSLNLIDLAGSENAKMAYFGDVKSERVAEGKFINKSLLTLSTIIQRMSEERAGGHKQHLPFRDSKLTRILQTPLSGNAKVLIICTISPTLRSAEESNNTLKFAARAKKITVDAKVNETFDDKTLLRQYKEEIETLKQKLSQMESMINSKDETANGGETKRRRRTHKHSTADNNTDLPAVGRSRAGSDSGDSSSEDEENKQEIILRMIDHMEKLILKSDLNRSPSKAVQTPGSPVKPKPINTEALTPASASKTPSSSSPSAALSKAQASKRISAIPTGVSKLLRTPSTGKTEQKDAPKVETMTPSSPAKKHDDRSQNRIVAAAKAILTKGKSNPSLKDNIAVKETAAAPEEVVLNLPDDAEATIYSSEFNNNGSEERKEEEEDAMDVGLLGISQMLSLLKAHVSKNGRTRLSDEAHNLASQFGIDHRKSGVSRQSSNASIDRVGSTDPHDVPMQRQHSGNIAGDEAYRLTGSTHQEQIEQLLLDLKLKNADNRFLQDEVMNLRSQIERKDNLLNVLTNGLKDVELAQARLIEAKNGLGKDLETTKRSLDLRTLERDRLEAEVIKLKTKLGIRVSYGDDEVEPSDEEEDAEEVDSVSVKSDSTAEQPLASSTPNSKPGNATPVSASRLLSVTPLLKRSNSKPLSTRK